MFEEIEEEELNIFEKIIVVLIAIMFFLSFIITMIIMLPVLIIYMIVCGISDAIEYHKCKKIIEGNKQHGKTL